MLPLNGLIGLIPALRPIELLLLAVLRGWLQRSRASAFTVAEFREAHPALAGFVTYQRVGSLLGLMRVTQAKKPRGGPRRKQRHWSARSFLQLADTYVPFTLSAEAALTLKSHSLQQLIDMLPQLAGTHYQRPYKAPLSPSKAHSFNPTTTILLPLAEVSYLNTHWQAAYSLPFSPSYEFAFKLLEACTEAPFDLDDVYTPDQAYMLDQPRGARASSCLTIDGVPLSEDGYLNNNRSLITRLLGYTDQTVASYPATSLSRLMAMVAYPLLDWGTPKQHPLSLHAHHTCRNRQCLNPLHLLPMPPKAHKALHMASHEATPEFRIDHQVIAYASVSATNLHTHGGFYV